MHEIIYADNYKEIVSSFLHLCIAGKIDDAYKYTCSNFRHHNPYFPGDKESLMRGMEASAKDNPNATIKIYQIIQEGNTVVVHSNVKHNPDDNGLATVHIFLFENNLITELWDICQKLPDSFSNQNSPF